MTARYSPDQRREAEVLALAHGSSEAMKRTGIPRRTIDRWMTRPSPEVVAARAATTEEVTGKLWQAVNEGTDQLLRRMRDPKARLSDVAQALRVAAEQYQLMTGGPTANNMNLNVNADAASWSESMSWEDRTAMRQFLDDALATPDEQLMAEMPVVIAYLSHRPELADKLRAELQAALLAKALNAGEVPDGLGE